jgi:hypothetical protein
MKDKLLTLFMFLLTLAVVATVVVAFIAANVRRLWLDNSL